ncbi:MAG TPA: hypothetical protein VNI77_12270 [Nitrososphaera sp.]|nr:hypothetical protein [Nitrososphaera sp.]
MVKDPFWSEIEDEVAIVEKFTPLAKVENGKVISTSLNTPYAYVTVESPKLTAQATLPVNHKLDFLHLWEVFNIRTVSDSEEVLVHFSRKHHRGLLKLFSYFLPRLKIMICRSGAYSKMSDPNWRKQPQGEDGFKSILPIQEWNPL